MKWVNKECHKKEARFLQSGPFNLKVATVKPVIDSQQQTAIICKGVIPNPSASKMFTCRT
jgi:hypothetical protein